MTLRGAVAIWVGPIVIASAVVGMRLARRARPPEAISPPAAVAGATIGPQRVEVQRSLMSTWVRIIAYGDDRQEVARAIRSAFGRMSVLERELSRFDSDSDVSRINSAPAGTPVTVGEDTWQVLAAAHTAWQRTGGVFDVTVGPLIALWRRSAERGRLPTEEELGRARACVGLDRARLLHEVRQVVLTEPGMSIDLGGVAKGYIVDRAVDLLRERSIISALVDAGGDIRVLGPRGDGRPWVTAVRNPETEDGRPFPATLAVSDVAVVTSGSYARYVEIAGRRYTYIIDPRTGRPETTVASSTVIGPDATSADALATALAVLGREEGIALIESLPQYECLIITGEGEGRTLSRSSGFARYEMPSPPEVLHP